MRRLPLLVALCLAGCTPAPPEIPAPVSPGAGPVVVTLGDSVPAGTACACTPFPDLYARLLSPGARSVNLAEPGYTSADVTGQLDEAGVRADLRAAGVVVVMVGANDLATAFDDGRDEAAYRTAATTVEANVRSTVAAAVRDHGGPLTVLVLGYWNVVKDGAVGLAEYGTAGLASAESATRYCNQALHRAAEQSGAQYVTTTPAFKGFDRHQDPTSLLASDGDHPNAAGHEAIAEAVYTAAPDP